MDQIQDGSSEPSISEMLLQLLLPLLWAALTQTPDIHIQGTLESGHPKNITCAVPWACERGTPPTFFWIGAALTSLGPKIPHTSVLTLTLGPQDHGTNLTCRVTFPGAGVSTERTVWLNVSYAPQKLTVHVFRDNSTGGRGLGGSGVSEVKSRDCVEAGQNEAPSLSIPSQSPSALPLPVP
ncbi:sialic acid-binding Ig-like lectin 6 [Diceros bicornis minor]|uniref:sialic acid-binding Ig-like lectin 6 n=1 Tax=Diceros bicornis minor TaxID=77932 RepID=UPI0026F19054|nr:sialic acid-binding Ig-like lectin 6 [Diceros bicornis minor]